MENEVYTQSELKAQNILTMDYALNLAPGDFIGVLDLKAQARPHHAELPGGCQVDRQGRADAQT